MSLDDECPTQYMGEDAVQVTIQGKEVSMSHEKFLRLTNTPGALTDEEMLNAKQWGLSLADLLAEANGTRVISMDNPNPDPMYDGLFHRPGCSIQRSGKCICAYIAQWDQTGETS